MSRRPLVYAGPGLLRQARTLLPTVGVIEEAIADEIVAGNVVPGRVGGMVVGSGWIAQFRREPGRTNRRRRTFVITGIAPHNGNKPGGRSSRRPPTETEEGTDGYE